MLFIFLILIIQIHSRRITYPITFTTVRQIPYYAHPNDIAAYLGVPFNNTINNQYNYVSLEGWTFNNSYTGACQIWRNAQNYFTKKSRFGSNTSQIQKSLKQSYKRNNISLLVTAFSLHQYPIISGYDPRTVAFNLSLFVATNSFDGVTIQLQDQPALVDLSYSLWVLNFTQYLRNYLPNNIIVYQLYASNFQKNLTFYTINSQIIDLIDFYVIKFYDVTNNDYNNQNALFVQSSIYLGTSVAQLIQIGIPPNKIVVGKPSTFQDTLVPVFFITIQDLALYFNNGYNKLGWYGGYSNNDYYNDIRSEIVTTIIETLRQNCDKFLNCN